MLLHWALSLPNFLPYFTSQASSQSTIISYKKFHIDIRKLDFITDQVRE